MNEIIAGVKGVDTRRAIGSYRNFAVITVEDQKATSELRFTSVWAYVLYTTIYSYQPVLTSIPS